MAKSFHAEYICEHYNKLRSADTIKRNKLHLSKTEASLVITLIHVDYRWARKHKLKLCAKIR